MRLLANDARQSNKQIAAQVGLAPSSCHERLKALRAGGVLLGAHADVSLRALGFSLEALLFVQVAKLETSQIDKLLREMSAAREVRNVFLISGHFDLVVHVTVRDMDQLKRVISENIGRHKAVLRVETSVVFDRKTAHELPI